MNLQALIQPYNPNYTSEAIGVKLAEWLKSPQFQYIWLISAFVSQSAMAGFEPVLIGAGLTGANLAGTDLSQTSLALTNLTNANLARANLKGAYFMKANLTGINLYKATFDEADFKVAINVPDGIFDI